MLVITSICNSGKTWSVTSSKISCYGTRILLNLMVTTGLLNVNINTAT